MMKYQCYAEYKDSGVEWLGEIPSHWDLYSLKRSVDKCTNGFWGAEPDGINDLCVLRVADFNRDNFLINENKLTFRSIQPKEAENRLLKKGDLLIEKSGGGDKTLVGCVVMFDKEFSAITSNFVAKMTPNINTDSKYLTYSFAHLYSGRVNFPSIKQTTGIQNLDSEAYLIEKFGFPPKNEQIQIANFLDHETAKIDSLIEKQQQLIQLLKEKRQAVISHAVTKGLNPDVAMKDSGVEWLGEVPEHWDTTKIKYVAELTPKKSEVSSNDNRLCTFVPMEKLKLGSLIKDEEKPISEVIGGYTYFKNGDLLLAKVTPCFENKNMVVASDLKNGIGFGSSEIYVLRTNHKVNTQFLYYRLQEDQFMELGTGAMTGAGGLKRVPSEFLNNFEFALPPLSEQIAITKYLNQYLIKNEYLMNKAQSAIQLMQERRTALISAAVTGKIDVRNWQNPTEAKMEFSA